MYETYWQLTQKPFEQSADPRFYYPGESHQAALLKLRYAVENCRGGALLAGAAGSGKTLVVNMLRKIVGESFTPLTHLVFPDMSTAELLAYLADELDGGRNKKGSELFSAFSDSASYGRQGKNSSDPFFSGSVSVQQSVRRIEHFLADNSQRGRHAVVVIDEAHLLENARTLEALRLLLNFEPGGKPGLTLILVGQPGVLPVLERMPQLEERLAVKCLLRPFSQQQTAEYVAHRLKVAGAVRPIFEPEALPQLHALTHGIARRINRLCDLALLIGFAEERQTLTAAHLEAVCQELVAVTPE
jgi:general secretion pathway protein A